MGRQLEAICACFSEIDRCNGSLNGVCAISFWARHHVAWRAISGFPLIPLPKNFHLKSGQYLWDTVP